MGNKQLEIKIHISPFLSQTKQNYTEQKFKTDYSKITQDGKGIFVVILISPLKKTIFILSNWKK